MDGLFPIYFLVYIINSKYIINYEISFEKLKALSQFLFLFFLEVSLIYNFI